MQMVLEHESSIQLSLIILLFEAKFLFNQTIIKIDTHKQEINWIKSNKKNII